TAASSVTRGAAITSALETELQAELTVFRVVEAAERRRRQIALHISRQECVEGVVGAHADPRFQLEDLESMLDAELRPRVRREAEQLVARPDEVEVLVDRRPQHAAAPVDY